MSLIIFTGPLHNPINFFQPVCLNTASALIPEGFVKEMIQAFGHNSSQSLIISKITGIVLNALNIPPGPFVS